MAPNVDLSSYSTFGFPEQTGTDRGGYSTIVTDYFKAAVTEQMQMRGYRYVDENPSLLVNFYANVDVVDAAKKQLVWEGVAQGRLQDADMDNPREAISGAMTQLFTKFPGRARAVDTAATH